MEDKVKFEIVVEIDREVFEDNDDLSELVKGIRIPKATMKYFDDGEEIIEELPEEEILEKMQEIFGEA